MSIGPGAPAWLGTMWGGTLVHWALCSTGVWGEPRVQVRDTTKPHPAVRAASNTAGVAVAVDTSALVELCHGC
jgi:hypothetical protein